MPRLTLALLLFVPAHAAADPLNPHLSDQQLAAGDLLLFDQETTFGWQVKGEAVVKDGVLVVGMGSTITYQCPLPNGSVVTVAADGTSNQLDHKAGETLTLPPKGGTPAGGYRKVYFTPDGLKPIFNGKDLTGWSVFKDEKRNKSQVEVTGAGELHITNGPGDVQTDGKYADFVLQLEFKTNGDGLNSGVFFRCIADQYQNGYEMQINNKMKDDDPTKPADGGTGAIYRRFPARKIVAKDNTWTHLTLIAKGPTFATWVNGYPVAVWTDERPKDENPRKGLRLEAGHLSLQGHDPTTDLLFRNIRLAEMK